MNREAHPTTYLKYCKRPLDLAVALPVFVLISPLTFAVWLFLAMTNKGKAIFRQKRIGWHERPFTLFKFRTLRTDASTPVFGGSLLRRTSLDELPQLWNVIRGDMSLIGPRPLYEQYLPHYSEYHRGRHQVRPGITGLAQVSGRNALSWSQKFDFDLEYVEKVSLALDGSILLRTIVVLFQFHKADFHEQDVGPFRGYEDT